MITYTKKIEHADSHSPVVYILGGRYDPELSNVQIAQEVRKLVKQAIKATLLPPMKVSVVKYRDSIQARITEASFEFRSSEYFEAKELLMRFLLSYQKSEHWENADYLSCNFRAFVFWHQGEIWTPTWVSCDHE